MQHPSTTSSRTIEATSDLAVLAVYAHAVEHGLAADSITKPRFFLGETSVIIDVVGDVPAEDWVNSIHVDTTTVSPTTHPEVPAGVFERAIWHGRLPDSGIRVSVVTVRRTGRRTLALTSLTGGAA